MSIAEHPSARHVSSLALAISGNCLVGPTKAVLAQSLRGFLRFLLRAISPLVYVEAVDVSVLKLLGVSSHGGAVVIPSCEMPSRWYPTALALRPNM